MKIGLLIPSTSNGRDWKKIQESYLYNHTLKSFLLTYDKEYSYTFYIGIDKDDIVYDNTDNMGQLKKFASAMKNIQMEFVYMDNIPKGHLTIMWNKLFETAYNDNCDYFFQCGDDIEFKTSGWVKDCINIQQQHNDVGVTGPIDKNNTRLLTQSFVSRKHMELFGYYFPSEIINWFCDDWINDVYKRINKFYPLNNKYCVNVGGKPRYKVNNTKYNNQHEFNNGFNIMKEVCINIVNRDLQRITDKL